MLNVSVSQLKTGEKLAEQVITKRGSLLFEKGRQLTAREIEILRAFLIPIVAIESKAGTETEEDGDNSPEDPSQSVLPFYLELDKMTSLLKRVFNLAQTNQTIPILDIRMRLESLLKLIDHYNILSVTSKNTNVKEYLIHNSVLVSLTAYQLAKWHGLPQKDLMQIALGGLFHDLGNVKIDDVVFEKKTRLTDLELEEMRKHTIFGYNILKNVPAINEGAKLCALQHHEREDGSGYPLGVKGDKIHLYAKIIAVADIFHAMTSNRHYKKAESPYLVLEQLVKESFGKLDPLLVQTFVYRVTAFHNGTVVRLSDERIGEIVFSDRANPTRPWVNVNGKIVNLSMERNLYIQEVLFNFN
ncbi:HD-GYP domain-containing protein [Paenibacillus cymbidii]|uniref:HD-GYP domain-containing protein n=1 Tax=Paenibacillus cymbidii TaxID=1639034 RepID=UPI00107FD92E|nr:HD-GYP domain-containing protein [Paenibacillus cymbidii]